MMIKGRFPMYYRFHSHRLESEIALLISIIRKISLKQELNKEESDKLIRIMGEQKTEK